MKKISQVDETLKNFGIEPEYNQDFQENLIVVVLWSFGAIMLMIIDCLVYTNEDYVVLNSFQLNFPIFFNFLISLNFTLKIW